MNHIKSCCILVGAPCLWLCQRKHLKIFTHSVVMSLLTCIARSTQWVIWKQGASGLVLFLEEVGHTTIVDLAFLTPVPWMELWNQRCNGMEIGIVET